MVKGNSGLSVCVRVSSLVEVLESILGTHATRMLPHLSVETIPGTSFILCHLDPTKI